MFLHLSVILFKGEGGVSVQGDPPYGGRAGGTPPSRMHSCKNLFLATLEQKIWVRWSC